ncbi:hypothetical protein BaRGS_00018096 [Batillaria attramentaria]|uniref:DDE Tnp4 domain-containing protein n=1 Tax=Batillaria attramentaria TaxID=370345 RepID=A0ABD0KU14_9CAEN
MADDPISRPADQAAEELPAVTSCHGALLRVNGVLKHRWHCLHSELRYQPLPAMKVIEACICLHNVARTLGLPDPDSDYEDEDGDEPQGQNNQRA